MHTFFVGYDYGMGGIWCFIRAASVKDIRVEYPNVGIWLQCPFFDDSLANRIKSENTYDLLDVDPLMDAALKEASPSDLSHINSKALSL